MRYAIVDNEGASRDYFSSRVSAREAIREIEEEAPGTAAELYVVTYDDDGEVGSPERGDELLSGPPLDWSDSRPDGVTIVSGASNTTEKTPMTRAATQEFAGAHI